jgi:hypothetical protein
MIGGHRRSARFEEKSHSVRAAVFLVEDQAHVLAGDEVEHLQGDAPVRQAHLRRAAAGGVEEDDRKRERGSQSPITDGARRGAMRRCGM